MCPRIKVLRKVVNPPIIKGFKPYGPDTGNQNPTQVTMLYEEYEALRLSDYDKLNHHQSSVLMGVSRPTFTRIYASALQKVAKAFVEGCQICFEGGKVYFDSDWFKCKQCKCFFNNPEKEKPIEHCPLCGNKNVQSFDYSTMQENNEGCTDNCTCPKCGFAKPHQHGIPCKHEICPSCNVAMVRKGNGRC